MTHFSIALDTVLSVLNMFSIILINYANMPIFICYTNSVKKKKKLGNFRSTRFCNLRRKDFFYELAFSLYLAVFSVIEFEKKTKKVPR